MGPTNEYEVVKGKASFGGLNFNVSSSTYFLLFWGLFSQLNSKTSETSVARSWNKK